MDGFRHHGKWDRRGANGGGRRCVLWRDRPSLSHFGPGRREYGADFGQAQRRHPTGFNWGLCAGDPRLILWQVDIDQRRRESCRGDIEQSCSGSLDSDSVLGRERMRRAVELGGVIP